MKGIVKAAINNRKVTLFVVVLLVMAGIYNYRMIPKQESPDLNVPFAMVTTLYPGASPEDVESLVTREVEDKLVEVPGYDHSISSSRYSLSTVILRLEHQADIDEAWDELRRLMKDLQDKLPQGCEAISVDTDLVETAGIIYSLRGEEFTSKELARKAEYIQGELSRIEGLSRFDVVGDREERLVVEVDTLRLKDYSLSLGDINDIIQAQNVEIPSGEIDDGEARLMLKVPAPFISLEEVENTVVVLSPEDGSVTRLKDIAHIYLEEDHGDYLVKHRGEEAVLLAGYFQEDKNILHIGGEVEKEIERIQGNLPGGMQFEKILYQPQDAQKYINNFNLNLLQGVAFIILVVLIGMGYRNALIVSTVLPLSILMTFSAMALTGLKVHQISIAALIIVMGMLVDNAIVVSDSIQFHINRGGDKAAACVEGVREVALPIFTSTLTTICAFLPLLFLATLAGEYIVSIPQIVIITLIFSYLAALLFTPVMSYILLKEDSGEESISPARRFFLGLLKGGLKHKPAVILLVVLLVAAGITIASNLGLQFFPKAYTDMIYIEVTSEQANDLDKTEEMAGRVMEILDSQPEVLHHTAAVGGDLPKFYQTLFPHSPSPGFAQFLVRVDLEKGDRFTGNMQLVDFLQGLFDSKVAGGTVVARELEQGEPLGSPVTIRVSGDRREDIEAAAREVKDILQEIQGTVNIRDDRAQDIFEYHVVVDWDKAGSRALSNYDIQSEVSRALRGVEAGVFRKEGTDYPILVKGGIDSIEDLENMGLKSSLTDHKLLLKDFADITMQAHSPEVKKYDREPTVTVYSDVRYGYNPVAIEDEVKDHLTAAGTEDVKISFTGEKEKIISNFGSMGSLSVFAVLLIFLVLLLQFNSFSQPLIILMTIPLSAIGSVTGLFITGQPLSFTGLLGIVSLMGIVVNNAIVLIDLINIEKKQGRDIHQACINGVSRRVKPILLSTTTTVMGLTPLLLSGSELFKPMSISLISGLIVSTFLTLIIIPVVYSMVER